MNRKMMIVANWKMHKDVHESSLFMHKLGRAIKFHRSVEVVIAPTMLAVQPLAREIDHRQFKLAVQNAYFADEGSFTGEVSFEMLHGVVDYAIVGHSERRLIFNEDQRMIRDKVKASVRNDITPILCVGETKPERDDGLTKQVLHDQVTTALANLTSSEIENVVVAYEPIWAIGSSHTEDPESIAKAIKWIRGIINDLYGARASESVRVLYGAGSEPGIVDSVLRVGGVDGLLVGHASLSVEKFSEIVDSAYRVQTGIENDGR